VRYIIKTNVNLVFLLCGPATGVSLLGIVVLVVVGADSEVTQLVRVLLVGHHTDPVTQAVLLQVLLGQVLEVGLGEVHIGADMELQLGALEGDVVAQVVHLAVDLKAGLHVLLLWAERNRDSRVSSAWIWTASSRQQPVRVSWS